VTGICATIPFQLFTGSKQLIRLPLGKGRAVVRISLGFRSFGVASLIDAIGLGAGVYNRCKELGLAVRGIDVGPPSKYAAFRVYRRVRSGFDAPRDFHPIPAPNRPCTHKSRLVSSSWPMSTFPKNGHSSAH
jgi:hypothetical protein